ncbi:aminotransferase class I/II-fold pyridoxal phosphate-dependent enzyme [Persephonella sp.]
MEFRDFLNNELNNLKKLNLYRERILIPKGVVDFSSNDYLGLKNSTKTKELLKQNLDELNLGSGASQLVSGYYEIQKELEDTISSFKGAESTVVVGSGYMANIGLIQSLTGEGDLIFSDQFNHASIIDGIRLSKAEKVIYKHNDMNDLEDKLKSVNPKRFRFIVTDGVFSMEGDIVNFKDLKYLADKYNAVIILDDAHGTGIVGEGRGTLFHFRLKPDENIIQMGTLSKAVGSYGAFISGSSKLVNYLVNRMRSLIFTTALSPIQNFISLMNFKQMIDEPFRRNEVLKKAEILAENLKKLGYNISYRGTPILSLIIGGEEETVRLRDLILEKGFFIQGIRPPTVPKGTSRLRITVTYNHTEKDLENLINIFKELRDEL